jgi:guanylate cyclase
MASWRAWLDRIGAREADSAELRLAKRNVVRSGAIMVPSCLIVLVECAAFGQAGGIVACALTALAHVANLALFARDGSVRGYMLRIGPLSIVTTGLLRFSMRAIPMSEILLLGALAWVVGAALGGNGRRLFATCAAWAALVVGTELAVQAWPRPVLHAPVLASLCFVINCLSLCGVLCLIVFPFGRGRRDLASALAKEHERSETLLLNVLPSEIAERLKASPGTIADRFESATVLFGDIAGFTPMSQQLSPHELVAALDEVFSAFDDIAHRHGLEKIKTIGDAYMVVGGVPVPRAQHAHAVAEMALEMREVIARKRFSGGRQLAMRIGIHTGEVVAGVIGKKKFSYDLWGDTVNTASRMESHGAPGEIHVSDAVRAALGDAFVLDERGLVEVKGKGPMRTWWLRRRSDREAVSARGG